MQASSGIEQDNAKQGARGRPRDPGLEARVFHAAMLLYAQAGWPGLTFDAVARAAGVGKAALYRRWPGRADLLRETLAVSWYPVGAIDEGTLAADLLALAGTCFAALVGPYGGAMFHLPADAARFTEVREVRDRYAAMLGRQARGLVRRAIARGELAATAEPGLIIDVIVGGVTNRVAATPPALREALIAQFDRFSADLVALVLGGIGMRE